MHSDVVLLSECRKDGVMFLSKMPPTSSNPFQPSEILVALPPTLLVVLGSVVINIVYKLVDSGDSG